MAAPRHARKAEAAKRARHWYHAKWIAINLALIAFTGWLYAEFLIPHFIVGDTGATRVAPDTWIADRPQEPSPAGRVLRPADQTVPAAFTEQGSTNAGHERRRPRREPEQTDASRAFFERVEAAKKSGRFRCVGGRPFELVERNGTTHVEQIGRHMNGTCTS